MFYIGYFKNLWSYKDFYIDYTKNLRIYVDSILYGFLYRMCKKLKDL